MNSQYFLSSFFKYVICMLVLASTPLGSTAWADEEEDQQAEEAEIKAQFSYTFDDVYDKLVIIECKGQHGEWSGSGFVAAMDGKTYLFTNQHIVLGADTISFKTAKGEVLRPPGGRTVCHAGHCPPPA